MELSAKRVLHLGEFREPAAEVRRPERRVPPAFRVPVDGEHRVFYGQGACRLARMVVDRSQAAHAAVGDVGPVRLRKLIMPRLD